MKWQMQEPGWYTSEIGGIVCERDKWVFWPVTSDRPAGSWKTLKEAQLGAESSADQQHGNIEGGRMKIRRS